MQILPDIVFNSFIINSYEITQVKCVYFDALQSSFQVAQYSFYFCHWLLKTKKKCKVIVRISLFWSKMIIFEYVLMTNLVNLINTTHNVNFLYFVNIIYFILECKELFHGSFLLCTFYAFSFSIQNIRDWFFSPWCGGKASIVENEKWNFFAWRFVND